MPVSFSKISTDALFCCIFTFALINFPVDLTLMWTRSAKSFFEPSMFRSLNKIFLMTNESLGPTIIVFSFESISTTYKGAELAIFIPLLWPIV